MCEGKSYFFFYMSWKSKKKLKQFERNVEKTYKPSNQTTKTKVLATFTIPKVLEMAISMTPVETYTKLALAQFITVFGDVCKENSMELKTEDGVEWGVI